jgi:microcystin-dependent protein
MSEPFVGEIRMFGGNFAPANWMFCEGQLLSIAEYDTLFSLIGTTYGGDGVTTFALPDLRGRLPIHQGQGSGLGAYVIGQMGGTENVTLATNQIPSHNHTAQANTESGTQSSPSNGIWANSGQAVYSANPATGAMNAALIGAAGGSQPHNNMMPFLCVSFIISLFGVWPQIS